MSNAVTAMADDVALVINGRRYRGWKSVRITRSIESLAGSFSLEVSDRWDGQTDPWPIQNEDACRVEIDGEVLIDGYVDTTDISATKDSRTLSYGGKDKAAAIVENSATVQGASVIKKIGASESATFDPTKHNADAVKWSYTNIDVADFTRAIARPHGLSVSVQAGLTFRKVPKVVVNPGETGWETVKRVAEAAGVLLVSDGAGGILITRTGTTRATILQEGFNVLEAGRRSDATNRFRLYLLSCQLPGTDEASGTATRIQAQATDDDVRRASRVLLIRPDKGYTTAEARARADWEARNRAARADAITCTVQGWRQPNGMLWPLNALTHVRAPTMIGVDGEMLISQVEYSLGSNGRLTQLRLLRPDAFEPEPVAAAVGGTGAWDELRKGV